MSLRISLELSEGDLQHFRLNMRAARDATTRLAPERIVATSTELLRKSNHHNCSGFIAERLQKLGLMLRMISDLDWRLPHADGLLSRMHRRQQRDLRDLKKNATSTSRLLD